MLSQSFYINKPILQVNDLKYNFLYNIVDITHSYIYSIPCPDTPHIFKYVIKPAWIQKHKINVLLHDETKIKSFKLKGVDRST